MKAPRERKVRETIVVVAMLVDSLVLIKYLFWDFMLGKANIAVIVALIAIWILCFVVIITDSYELK